MDHQRPCDTRHHPRDLGVCDLAHAEIPATTISIISARPACRRSRLVLPCALSTGRAPPAGTTPERRTASECRPLPGRFAAAAGAARMLERGRPGPRDRARLIIKYASEPNFDPCCGEFDL